MIMDTTKKYLYFNDDTGDTDGSVMMPVSTCVGFETTGASDVKFYFKSAPDTDTLDIQLNRTADSNPRELFEYIVNQINFAKDSVVTIGDDFTEEYIHPDITSVANISTAAQSSIIFSKPVTFLVNNFSAGLAEDAGNGFDTGSYTANTGSVGMINGEVITTIFINLGTSTGGVSATTDGNQNKVIGKAGATANASVTKITEAKNGVVYGAELICVETPTGTNIPTDIDVRVTTDSLTTGDNISAAASLDNLLLASGNMAKGDRIRTDDNQDSFGGMNDHFVYLSEGANHATPGTDGAYSTGKFILRLFGAPTSNLNDIS